MPIFLEAKVLGGLEDPLIKDWYEPDRDRISSLSWDEFKKELKEEVLPADWEDDFSLTVTDMRHENGHGSSDIYVKQPTCEGAISMEQTILNWRMWHQWLIW